MKKKEEKKRKCLSVSEVKVGTNGRECSHAGSLVERGLKRSYRIESKERLCFGDKQKAVLVQICRWQFVLEKVPAVEC